MGTERRWKQRGEERGEESGGGEWEAEGREGRKRRGEGSGAGRGAEARDWLRRRTDAPTSPGVKAMVTGGKLGVTMPLEGSTGTFSGPVTLHTWHRLSRPGIVGPSLPHPWPQAQGCVGCLPTPWPAPDLWASCEPLTQGVGGPRDLVACY